MKLSIMCMHVRVQDHKEQKNHYILKIDGGGNEATYFVYGCVYKILI